MRQKAKTKKEVEEIEIDLTLSDSELDIELGIEGEESISSEESSSSSSASFSSSSKGNFNPPIRIAGNVLSGRHYRLLERGGWFTDDLINAYFHLLGSSRVFCFSSFLLEAADSHGFTYVSRYWMRRFRNFVSANAEQVELVLFPVNSGASHWVLVAWWLKRGAHEYYDSLMCKRTGRRIMEKISALLEACNLFASPEFEASEVDCLEQFMSSLSLTVEKAEFSSLALPPITKLEIPVPQPRQQDGSSCGPFTCAMARALVRGETMTGITQRSVDEFRREMIGVFLGARES